MTIGIDVFMQGFTLEERAQVAARSAELIEAELTGRPAAGQASDAGADGGTDGGGAGERVPVGTAGGFAALDAE